MFWSSLPPLSVLEQLVAQAARNHVSGVTQDQWSWCTQLLIWRHTKDQKMRHRRAMLLTAKLRWLLRHGVMASWSNSHWQRREGDYYFFFLGGGGPFSFFQGVIKSSLKEEMMIFCLIKLKHTLSRIFVKITPLMLGVLARIQKFSAIPGMLRYHRQCRQRWFRHFFSKIDIFAIWLFRFY